MKKFAAIPIDRKSLHSFFLVSLMTFLAKMAIVLKEVVMASRYGRQDELDAFLIAFLLPAFVGSLLSNTMNSSFIPVYIQLERDGGESGGKGRGAAQDLFAGISALNLAAVAVIATLTFLAGISFLPKIASGFSGSKMDLTMRLLALLIPYILLSGISALWSAVLNAQERFRVVVLTPVISPLLIVVLLLLFPSGGIRVLAYGVLAGIFIETIVLGVALRRRGQSLWPRWTGWSPAVWEVVRQFLPAAAGGCLMGSVLIVDQSMAAMLAPGSVAALSYGNKAIGFLLALLTATLVTFLTPYFSRRMIDGGGGIGGSGEELGNHSAGGGEGGGEALGGLLRRWLGIAFLLGLLCSFGIVLFSEPLARLIFYRGAFNLTDLRLVAGVQSQLAWQIPFYICAVILTRYIAAMRWNRIIFIVAACNVTANILLNEFLMRRMGVEGIALATSLVHVFSLLLLMAAIGRNWIFFLRRITRFLYRFRGLSRVADLVRMAYIHSPRRYLIDDLDGDLRFDCALNEHISSQIFWRGDYSTGQLALLRRLLKPGMVFLDAGANKGEFTVIAAKYVAGGKESMEKKLQTEGMTEDRQTRTGVRGGKVLAFEPMDKTAEELKENIAANGFSHVQVFQQALGKTAGERIIYHAEDAAGKELNLGTFTLYPRTGLDKPCGRIGVVSLDEFMRAGAGAGGTVHAGEATGSGDMRDNVWTERIDVMKIDIEGGELEMLEGAVETIRSCRPVIFIEVNAITSKAAGYDQSELLRWLERAGYRCERIGRKGRTVPITVAGLKGFQNLVCWPGAEQGEPAPDDGKRAAGVDEDGRAAMEDGGRGAMRDGVRTAGQKIAFFIPDLRGGGAEKAVCNLLNEMTRRRPKEEFDLVLVNASGVYLKELSPQARVIDLHCKRTLSALPALVRYLKNQRPSALIAHLSHANTIALLAKKIAGVDIPVVVVEHTILHQPANFPGKQWLLEWMMKKLYPGAAARVAVSEDTARQIERRLGLRQGAIKCIYNPVVSAGLLGKAALPLSHPWLEKKEMPVFLGAGRLEPQKDFALLLQAFALLRKKHPAKLIILGEGSLRRELEEQARRLGVGQDIDFPGFVENPFAYMSRCDAFVLSSRWEGLSNVLIEAMACGCPVIATDCPAGPREVLQDGKFGILVPVGDAEAMAEAMERTLEASVMGLQGRGHADAETPGGEWMRIGKWERMERGAFFSSEMAADGYLSLLNDIGSRNWMVKMRVVLHLITSLRTGGAERMLCRLVAEMDRERWDPVVISLTDGSAPEVWLREQGIPVHCLGMRAGTLPGPAMLMKLRRLVKMIRPDLIQGWMYHGNLAAQFAGRCLSGRRPVIWSIHHSIGSLAAEKPMTRSMIRLGARLSGLPDKIVYVSQVSAGQHRALGYRADRGIVIPYGVDPEFFLPSAESGMAVRAELGLSPDDLVIGSLARYHPMKDHENFLRAAALLAGRHAKEREASSAGMGAPDPGMHPDLRRGLRFLLAGTGVDAGNTALRSLIRESGLTDRVLLLGEREDVPRLLAALDIFTVSSSRGEALPVVLLEAMSCGVPCVTTDVGDAALLVGGTGRVVGVVDPEALAAAWAELIAAGEEKRKGLGAAARARIIAQYSLSANAVAYDELYRELLNSRRNL